MDSSKVQEAMSFIEHGDPSGCSRAPFQSDEGIMRITNKSFNQQEHALLAARMMQDWHRDEGITFQTARVSVYYLSGRESVHKREWVIEGRGITQPLSITECQRFTREIMQIKTMLASGNLDAVLENLKNREAQG